MTADAKRSTLAHVVLALLHTVPMHPYQIQQKLKLWHKDRVVNVRQRAGLYRTIERLHAAGLVAAAKETLALWGRKGWTSPSSPRTSPTKPSKPCS